MHVTICISTVVGCYICNHQVEERDRMKWEYLILGTDEAPIPGKEKWLNDLGDEGWELVSYTATPNPIGAIRKYIFKRRKEE